MFGAVGNKASHTRGLETGWEIKNKGSKEKPGMELGFVVATAYMI